jgi:NADPH:quinone reductase-like Zn-dependent oxidoreductase
LKAVVCERYGSPDFLKVVERERPVPRASEVLVKIAATAVTSSDVYIRRLDELPPLMRLMAWLVVGVGKPRSPILGMILSGEVEAVGARVRRFKAGDQVFGTTVRGPTSMNFGTYAEYKCVSEDSFIARKPANLDHLGSAALVYGGCMALWCLDVAGFPRTAPGSAAGKRVLVYGASGAVGTSLVQLAVAFGAEVTGVCSAGNFALVGSLGASRLLDYTQEDFTASGQTWDYVFDAVGYQKSRAACANHRRALAPGGVFHSMDDGSPKNSVEYLDCLRGLAEQGVLRPVVDRVLPLSELAEAHRYVDGGHKKGNVLIRVP